MDKAHVQEQVDIALEVGDGTIAMEKEATMKRRMSTTHRFES
jgi:hypothetical protein